MATLKFRDRDGWTGIAAFKGEDGKDGAIQYTAGPGIKIENNIISATLNGEGGVELTVDQVPTKGSTNPVASGGVYDALTTKADVDDIPTNLSALNNDAGFVTEEDIPKDLGDLTNAAGFLTEEADPMFKASAASSITAANIANWNKVLDYTLVPLHLDINLSDASLYDFSYTYKDASFLNRITALAGSFKKAIISLTTAGISAMLFYAKEISTDTNKYVDYTGVVIADDQGHVLQIKLRIKLTKESNEYVDTTITTLGAASKSVLASEVLKKDNTDIFLPTMDYQPSTKKYVDDAIKELAEKETPDITVVESDPLFLASPAAAITDGDIFNWNNKADSVGITEELDPTVPTHVKNITLEDLMYWGAKADSSEIPTNLSDLNNDAGYLTEESDFNNSVAATITNTDLARWDNKQDLIEFNTPYSSVNKAATMADIPDIPTKVSELNNDVGYITEVNATDVIKDNYVEVASNGAKLVQPYNQLNKILVKDGVMDYKNILANFEVLQNNSIGNTISYSVFYGDVASIDHTIQPSFSNTGTLIAGVDGTYDTLITFKPYTIISNTYASYAVLQQYQFSLLVNEANILNNIEGNYALIRTLKTFNAAKYN